MTAPEFIPFAPGERCLDWLALIQAIERGHDLPRAKVTDSFLYRGEDTLLNRAAWIDGLGLAVKSATIFPAQTPSINGGVSLYSDTTGVLEAVIDFHLVTKWKTAADSLLAARKLAIPDARNILIVGAGTLAHGLREAYGAGFGDAKFSVWNRTASRAERLAANYPDTNVAADLERAVGEADIITCATMATDPVIKGAWLRPGQHLDLVGAYRPDMREADDEAIATARKFVDNRDTVLGHIGEFKIPLAAGLITADQVVGDFYDLPHGVFQRGSADEITVFKNGGGAHLDLMTCRHILDCWRQA